MPKLLLLTLATLAISVMPAAAQTTPEPTQPCASSDQFSTLGLAGKDEAFSPQPVPSFGYDIVSEVQPSTYREESVTRFRYRLDVSGSATKPFAKNATVELLMNWDNDTDLDLFVYDASGAMVGESANFNPLDGAGETVTLAGVNHCSDLRVEVVNYLSTPLTAVTLDVNVKSLKP
jgi:hypothetical protein